MNKSEQIEKLEEQAIEYRHFKVTCVECDETTEELEYPSGSEAYDLGLRVYEVGQDEEYVFCQDCVTDGVLDSWRDD